MQMGKNSRDGIILQPRPTLSNSKLSLARTANIVLLLARSHQYRTRDLLLRQQRKDAQRQAYLHGGLVASELGEGQGP